MTFCLNAFRSSSSKHSTCLLSNLHEFQQPFKLLQVRTTSHHPQTTLPSLFSTKHPLCQVLNLQQYLPFSSPLKVTSFHGSLQHPLLHTHLNPILHLYFLSNSTVVISSNFQSSSGSTSPTVNLFVLYRGTPQLHSFQL